MTCVVLGRSERAGALFPRSCFTHTLCISLVPPRTKMSRKDLMCKQFIRGDARERKGRNQERPAELSDSGTGLPPKKEQGEEGRLVG